VKHDRSDNFTLANLENTLDAVAGLYCLELAYHRPKGLWRAAPLPKLLYVDEAKLIDALM